MAERDGTDFRSAGRGGASLLVEANGSILMSATYVIGAAVAAILIAGLFALWWYAWSVVLRWLRVVWVCRVPASSGALGMALFSLAEPARDLFLESQPYRSYWLAFFGAVLAWAAGVHFTARKLLEQQAWAARGARLPLSSHRVTALTSRYMVPATWVPRLLGLLCVAAPAVGIWGAHRDVAPIRDAFGLSEPARLLWADAACLVLYLAYLLLRRYVADVTQRRKSLPTYLRDTLSGRDVPLLTEASPFWFVDLSTARGRAGRSSDDATRIRWDLLTVALLGAQTLTWITAIVAPLPLAEILSRALFVMAMLFLPVSLLSYLSALSHRWRVPVVGLSFMVLVTLTGLTARFHDLRVEGAVDGPGRRGLSEAVAAWQAANCGNAEPGTGGCQARPVIVASAGGASRAAFFTATVIGEMLDKPALNLRSRLFAISGVSGGSVGAAMVRAALSDAGSRGEQPCGRVDDRWFGPHEKYGTGTEAITWKVCLQTLTAGDFLSPAFIGLAFRDLFGFLGLEDRARLLELSFERRYNQIVRNVSDEEGSSLARLVGGPVGATAPRWVPLLMLNATSVKEGRRSIISDLRPDTEEAGKPSRLFPTAFDLFETLDCEDRTCAGGATPRMSGVRLSSAATASARFPVISPQAGVRRGEELRDMLVDGGYFENDGLTTARELAEALVRLGLRPIIVHITNNPVAAVAEGGPAVRLPEVPRAAWHDALTAPVEALVGTRDGHALDALDRARHTAGVKTLTFQVYNRVPRLAQGQACSFPVRGSVDDEGPPMKDVSMSWWLSGAVQGYLDRQLCHPNNVDRFDELATMLSAQ